MENLDLKQQKIIIAGPCALENKEQLRIIVKYLKEMGLTFVRAPLWKPRTLPGWDGLGWKGLLFLLEETIPYGVIPATEVLNPEHATVIVDAMKDYGNDASILVWLGARNQNHTIQTQITEILKKGSDQIILMFKNQMWDDEKHWLGIYKHILSTGFPQERLLMCHRGFAPGKMENPDGYRNLPDFEMSMRMKESCGLPVLIDASHIAGERGKVFDICRIAAEVYDFDGYMIEVHHQPENALTDSKQQLNFEEFTLLLAILRAPKQAQNVCS